MLRSNSEPGPSSTGATDITDVNCLLNELERNLASAKASVKQSESLLRQLKVLGRDPNTAGQIFSKRVGIEIISKYALDKENSPASLEALRCLANALLLDEPSRQTFVDLGYAPKAATRLKNSDLDEEFVISRILFLLTYTTNVDLESLVNENALADSINLHISQHAKRLNKSGRRKSQTHPMEDMALAEVLKLLFNVTYYRPELIPRFTPAVEPLINIIMYHPLPNPPLESPIKYVLNALLNLDLKAAEKKTPMGREAKTSPLFPYSNPEQVPDRLIGLFDKAIRSYPEKELDLAAAPLCTLIRRTYELANNQMKYFMRWILLPRDKDRDKPLGQGDMISARLLRLSCSPNLPNLRENISNLLFELSDKDASKFVRNIGYGFASGFLMSHNIDIPANAAEAGSIAIDGDFEESLDVNPVTGQRRSAEKQDKPQENEEKMTQEEKEREAERLFVLFERLKATGVVDVKNPVQQAVDEGRFEELPD